MALLGSQGYLTYCDSLSWNSLDSKFLGFFNFGNLKKEEEEEAAAEDEVRKKGKSNEKEVTITSVWSGYPTFKKKKKFTLQTQQPRKTPRKQ